MAAEGVAGHRAGRGCEQRVEQFSLGVGPADPTPTRSRMSLGRRGGGGGARGGRRQGRAGKAEWAEAEANTGQPETE